MVQIATRITEEEKEKLQRFANRNDLSIAQVLRRMVKEFLEKQENKS